jgi:glycosyltransferase involved in cell wall biosynthesis
MNLLFVVDIPPFPVLHGSSVISWHWLQQLAGRHAISLVSIAPLDSQGAAEEIEALGVRLLDGGPARSNRLSTTLGLLRGSPLAMSRVAAGGLRRRLLECLSASGADAMVLIGPTLAAVLATGSWPVPVLFVPFDSVSLNLESRLPQLHKSARFLHSWIEVRRWRRVEQLVYPQADACVLVAQRDAESVSWSWHAQDQARLHVVPNGVDLDYFKPRSVEQRPNHLVFTGDMGVAQSVFSLVWFLGQVFPRVQELVPGVTFSIVGRNPHPTLERQAARLSGVEVTGFVPDLRQHIAEASVYVAPLRLGSGIKNRVLEAMAMGKPVVATSLSCHGLHPDVQRAMLVAEEPEEWAQALSRLLGDAERRGEMGRASRQAIEAHHSWGQVVAEVERILQDLTSRGPGV